jgi:mevalonate kinase
VSARASAGGKVILLGEHAVVYGSPALAAAISPGVDASASHGDGLSLTVSPWGQTFRPGDGSDLGRALQVLGAVLHGTNLHLDATMHLPGGGGLGSSAALGVACLRAAASTWQSAVR